MLPKTRGRCEVSAAAEMLTQMLSGVADVLVMDWLLPKEVRMSRATPSPAAAADAFMQ